MADLLQLRSGSKSYGSKRLFDEATFSIGEGDHVGVIGPNGAGKTTLFKIIAGEETLDSGELICSRALRLGYLPQHDAWNEGETVESFLSRDVSTPIWTLKKLARGLGLQPAMFDVPITSLSGGYRMRIKLLHLIGQEPNLMLLDEPTNYLDLETLVVLENFLQGFEGALMLISHDREFLRRTASSTLEVESGDIASYPGTIDDYFEQKALMRTQLESRAQSQSEKRKQILDFVARFGAKATKAKQAQSRLKSLSKMETIELKSLPVRARIRIPTPLRTGKLVLNMDRVGMGYPSKTVIQPADLQIITGDHVAVVGLNGAGKSTLLKTLARQIEPLSGKLEYGYQVTVGYYAQHVAEGLNLSHTVLEAMESVVPASVTRQEVLDLAGSLLFSGDSVYKRLSVLSGGERARVALGQILLQRASCLILDEPTNHLDFDTVEALTQALMDYPGTVITVSHDRSFTRRIGTKILEIDQGKLNLYFGTYDDYVWKIQNMALNGVAPEKPAAVVKSPVVPATASTAVAPSQPGNQFREAKKNLDRDLKQSEKAIQTIESQMADLARKLSEHIDNNDFQKINEVQIQLHTLEEQWMKLAEKKEQTETALRNLISKS